MLDLYAGIALVAGAIGFIIGMVLAATAVYTGWQRDITRYQSRETDLRQRVAASELDAITAGESAEQHQAAMRSGHPSVGGVVVSLDARRGRA